MTKITSSGTLVEIEGDEMARVVWGRIKDRLITPFLAVPIETYDLSLANRDRTGDAVTLEAAAALKRHGAAVKCATITPDAERARRDGLKQVWKSCNGTIRRIVGGDIFREPIVCPGVPRLIPHWRAPIVIGRHGFGDLYSATELDIPGEGTLTLVFRGRDGREMSRTVHDYAGPGVALAMVNRDDTIADFARATFNLALQRGLPVFLSTKNTVLKVYDARFKDIFETVYQAEFRTSFEARGLGYRHRLIDDMVAFALKSEGGFIWACKNYDGDVQSDFVAQGFGSLGLMTSIMVTPDGRTLMAEAAHGTLSRHHAAHVAGETVRINPMALIFAWTRALRHRAMLDANPPLADFVARIERSVLETVEAGDMTADLAKLSGAGVKALTTDEFLTKVVGKFRNA